MNDRRQGDRRVPPAVAQHAIEERAELLARIEDLEACLQDTESRRENSSRNASAFEARMGDLQVENGKLSGRIEEQAREVERIQGVKDNYCALLMDANQELAALKAKPSGVVLPEPFDMRPFQTVDQSSANYKAGFNAAIRKARESLNSHPVSAGVVDERAAFEEWFSQEASNAVSYGNPDIFRRQLWPAWQARAALTAQPAHSAQSCEVPDGWSLAADQLPGTGKTVLAFYLNRQGIGRRIRAQHITRFSVEAGDFADPDTDCVEYSEAQDSYYILEGWYECVDNWGDYSRIAVNEGVITHWMPMPAAPAPGKQEGGDK